MNRDMTKCYICGMAVCKAHLTEVNMTSYWTNCAKEYGKQARNAQRFASK